MSGVSRSTLRMAVLIVLLAINLRTVFASLPPLLTDVRHDLGLSAAVAGLVTTLPVVLLGALAPVAPRLAQRFPIERILVACALLTGAGVGVRGLGGVGALFAGSLLAGAAIAITQVLIPVLIRDRYHSSTGLLMGVMSAGITLSAAVGSGLAVPLEDLLGDSWQASLAAWAVPALVAAAAWLPRAVRSHHEVDRGPVLSVWRVPLAWSVAVFFAMQSMAFYATLAWLPSILRDHGYHASAAGALAALAQVVQFAPAFLVPVLAARSRTQGALLAAIVGFAAAGLIGLLAAPGAAALWMVFLGLGQGGALGMALILPVLRGGDVRMVAALTAMSMCAGYLIASVGPFLVGAAHDLAGNWTVPMVVLIVMTTVELIPGVNAVRDRRVAPAVAAA
jgi:MFS transporter, CP family, cyanate transporter